MRARRLPPGQLRGLARGHGAWTQPQFFLDPLDDSRRTGVVIAVRDTRRSAEAILARGIDGQSADVQMLACRILMNGREPGDRAIPQLLHVMDRSPRPLLQRQMLLRRHTQRPMQHRLRQIAARCPQPGNLLSQSHRSLPGQSTRRQPLRPRLVQNVSGQAPKTLPYGLVSNHWESFSRILPTKSIIVPKCPGFTCWQFSLSRLSVDNSRPSIPQTSWVTADRARDRRRPRAASRSHADSGRPQALARD